MGGRPAVSAASLAWNRAAAATPVPAVAFIVWGAALHAALGLAALGASAATGHSAWVELFRSYPGAIFLVELAAVELRLSRAAWRRFSPGEPLATVWFLLMAGAVCHLAGAFILQVLGAETVFNPLARWYGFWTPANVHALRDFGAAVGGSMQMALAACGIGLVLRAFRRCGLPARPGKGLWLAVALAAGTAGRVAWEATATLGPSVPATSESALRWVSAALAGVLVVEAACLYSFAAAMGRGLAARCWMACAAGAGLTALADLAGWAARAGLITESASAVTWYAGLAAAAACALAPAWQVEMSAQAAGEASGGAEAHPSGRAAET